MMPQNLSSVFTVKRDKLLKFLKEGDYLRNILLILMSDHGARFSSLRSSLQGKQEERLPLFGFHFQNGLNQNTAKLFKMLNKMQID